MMGVEQTLLLHAKPLLSFPSYYGRVAVREEGGVYLIWAFTGKGVGRLQERGLYIYTRSLFSRSGCLSRKNMDRVILTKIIFFKV